MYQELEYYLGAEGPLAEAWPGYETRPGQITMAQEVARAFQEDDIALIEAGTGTGKTLAYILPALLSGKKTVVSTGLKNLQDQIFDKDIPFIQKYFGDNFRVALLKGRENYLCRRLLKAATAQRVLFSQKEEELLDEIQKWVMKTLTGDRAELKNEGGLLWAELSSPSDKCQGQRCQYFDECFLWQARRKAAAADLVLVNHHLFMADLAVRQGGFGEVIPEWEAAIFDEAHLLEEAATSYFSRSISSLGLKALRRDIEALAHHKAFQGLSGLNQLVQIFARQTDAFNLFYQNITELELWQDKDPEAGPLNDFLLNFYHDSLALALKIKEAAQKDEDLLALNRRLFEYAENLLFLAEASDRNYVYQAERQKQRLTLAALPINVSAPLSELLINSGRTLVFTSATIATGRNFDYFKERLGLWPETEGLSVESPFNYANQTITYLPKHLPSPKEESFLEKISLEIEKILEITQGRSLVLFTSYRSLDYVAQKLRAKVGWPVLVQGEMNRPDILACFTKDIHASLMATHSFWQGVDVPGQSLSAVIIEKLPFPRPDRPLIKARSLALEEEGRDSFLEYFIPEAALTLKQGLGRLMRKADDAGLLAILDGRLTKTGYGKKLLKILPPSPQTTDLTAVAEFFHKIGLTKKN